MFGVFFFLLFSFLCLVFGLVLVCFVFVLCFCLFSFGLVCLFINRYFQFGFKIRENEMRLRGACPCRQVGSSEQSGFQGILGFCLLSFVSLSLSSHHNLGWVYCQRSLIAGGGIKYLPALVEDLSPSAGLCPADGCPLPQELSHARSAEDVVLSRVLPALRVENLKVMEIALKLLHIFGERKVC